MSSAPESRSPLPAGYYLVNFELLLDTVVERYGDLLSAAERAFYVELRALSLAARRLYVRLLGRRGPLVRCDRLRYPEIADVDAAVDELVTTGFADRGEAAPLAAWLALPLRAELAGLWQEAAPESARMVGRRPLRRDELAALLASAPDTAADTEVAAQALAQRIARLVPAVGLRRQAEVTVFRLLFFGNLRQDLSEFVLRDLGVVRFEDVPLDPARRFFPDRAAVDDTLRLRALAYQTVATEEVMAAAEVVLQGGQRGDGAWHPLAQRFADRILLAAGRLAERRGDPAAALRCYAAAEAPPARERSARVRLAASETAAAAELVAAMARAPRDESEVVMAERLATRLARLGVPLPLPAPTAPELRRRRRPARPEDLPLGIPPGDESVETRTLVALAARGEVGFFAENWLWRAIFGLAFWDIVFAPLPAAFHHPFQYGPSDLDEPAFRARRASAIADRLAALAATTDLEARLLAVWDQKFGVANRLVAWADELRPRLALALARLAGDQVAAVCDRLSRDLRRYDVGFPDLFVVDPSGSGFTLYEVKAPGDQLRPEQRAWLRYFAEVGIPARLLRVRNQEVLP